MQTCKSDGEQESYENMLVYECELLVPLVASYDMRAIPCTVTIVGKKYYK